MPYNKIGFVLHCIELLTIRSRWSSALVPTLNFDKISPNFCTCKGVNSFERSFFIFSISSSVNCLTGVGSFFDNESTVNLFSDDSLEFGSLPELLTSRWILRHEIWHWKFKRKNHSKWKFFLWKALILTLPCARELLQLKSNNISMTSFSWSTFPNNTEYAKPIQLIIYECNRTLCLLTFNS